MCSLPGVSPMVRRFFGLESGAATADMVLHTVELAKLGSLSPILLWAITLNEYSTHGDNVI